MITKTYISLAVFLMSLTSNLLKAEHGKVSTDKSLFTNISNPAARGYRTVATSEWGCSAHILPGIPDLSLTISASSSTYSLSTPINTLYKVTNIGNAPTNGSTITLTVVADASAGNFTYALPSGWDLQSQTGNTFVFKTNKIMNMNDHDTITLTYTASLGQLSLYANFNGSILSNSGSEVNNLNNNSSLAIPLQDK